MKYSLRLRHKILVVLLALFILGFFILQNVLSSRITKSIQGSLLEIAKNTNLIIISKGVSFDLIRGLDINGLSIGANPEKPVFKVRQVKIRVSILPLFLKKIVIKSVYLDGARLVIPQDEKERVSFWDLVNLITKELPKDQYRSVQMSIFGLDTFIKNSEIVFYDSTKFGQPWSINIDARISLNESGALKSKGAILLKHKMGNLALISKLFPASEFIQAIEFDLDGYFKKNDIYLDNIALWIGFEKVSGKGFILDYKTSYPSINLGIGSNNFALETITSLNRDFNLGGPVAFSCSLFGKAPDLKFNLRITLFGCSLLDSNGPFNIKNIIGRLEFSNDNFDIKNLFLIINNYPLEVNLNIRDFQNPDLLLTVVPKARPSKQKSLSYFEALLQSSGNNEDKTPSRNLLLKALISDATGMVCEESTLDFKDIYFSATEQPKYNPQPNSGFTPLETENFKQRSLTGFNAEVKAGQILYNSASKIDGLQKLRKLEFYDLKGLFSLTDNKLSFENLNLKGYTGQIVLDVMLNLVQASPIFYTVLSVEDIDTEKLIQDLSIPKNISGRIYAKTIINNNSRDYLNGLVDIKEGNVSGITILDALADFMRLPKLKSIDFEDLHANFKIYKDGLKKYYFKLFNKDISLDASLFIDKDDNMEGSLNTSISENFLRESGQFRLLLNMLENQAPFIDFGFKIGGVTGAPRFSWLKNEFKQGLERILSKGRQKILEDSINSMVDELFQQGSQ